MKQMLHRLACLFLLMPITINCYASLIQQEYFNGADSMFTRSIGQTFTAEDVSISSIGFYVLDQNQSFGVDDFDLTLKLYEGEGDSGALLASATFSDLIANSKGNIDFDIPFSGLTLGDTYTAVIENDTPRWLVGRNHICRPTGVAQPIHCFYEEDYIGGSAIIDGVLQTDIDLTFSVTPVPIPAAVWLFCSGLFGLVGFARRKK